MKLLLDQDLSFKLCARLADLFPGATQARLIGYDRADDRELWQYAADHGFALVTQDADFAQLATLLGPPPRVIWLRCGNAPTAHIEALLRRHAEAIAAFHEDALAACLELY